MALNISMFGTGTPSEIITQCSNVQTYPSLLLFSIIGFVVLFILIFSFFSFKENKKRAFYMLICYIILMTIIAVGIGKMPNVFHPVVDLVKSLLG